MVCGVESAFGDEGLSAITTVETTPFKVIGTVLVVPAVIVAVTCPVERADPPPLGAEYSVREKTSLPAPAGTDAVHVNVPDVDVQFGDDGVMFTTTAGLETAEPLMLKSEMDADCVPGEMYAG
jgi:hypothetical protein